MIKEQLRQVLKEEVEKHAASLSYEKALAMKVPLVEQLGMDSADLRDFYQVSVRLLEAVDSDRECYAHVTVSVDDGQGYGIGRLRVVVPQVASLIFHKDGRVETVFREP
jgi:hypothetical protein